MWNRYKKTPSEDRRECVRPLKPGWIVGCMRLLLFAAIGSSAPVMLGQGPTPPAGGTATASANSGIEMSKPPNADPDYVIGADDVLSVDVWKEPDHSRTVPVRPDGKISLPLLNDFDAAGLTPTQLASSIAARLRTIVVNPQVTVIVTQINSRRIYVLGEVIRAGAYPLASDMTVLQALSTAGGFTPFADVNKIHVIRTEKDRQVILHFRYKEVISGQKPEQNIRLKPGDSIVVP
jgi:polysaccharide export outer membrane protein